MESSGAIEETSSAWRWHIGRWLSHFGMIGLWAAILLSISEVFDLGISWSSDSSSLGWLLLFWLTYITGLIIRHGVIRLGPQEILIDIEHRSVLSGPWPQARYVPRAAIPSRHYHLRRRNFRGPSYVHSVFVGTAKGEWYVHRYLMKVRPIWTSASVEKILRQPHVALQAEYHLQCFGREYEEDIAKILHPLRGKCLKEWDEVAVAANHYLLGLMEQAIGTDLAAIGYEIDEAETMPECPHCINQFT